jgi:hypothetical protein
VGGSGGGYRITGRQLESLQAEMAARADQQRADAEVASYLRNELLNANERNVDSVNDRLDQIEEALRAEIEPLDRLLFGGSIAKHTYVEGVSDVDSLVILKDSALADRPASEFRSDFAAALRRSLPMDDIESINVGNLAVTVVYKDGTEIQLLPAVERGDTVSISRSSGDGWNHGVRPQVFSHALRDVNRAQGGTVVPVVKLAKEIVANSVVHDRPTGYHIENLALHAFDGYEGGKTQKEMLTHFFRRASELARTPLRDVTGQSANVDDYLGGAGSPQRRALADRLESIAGQMENSRQLESWKQLFGEA